MRHGGVDLSRRGCGRGYSFPGPSGIAGVSWKQLWERWKSGEPFRDIARYLECAPARSFRSSQRPETLLTSPGQVEVDGEIGKSGGDPTETQRPGLQVPESVRVGPRYRLFNWKPRLCECGRCWFRTSDIRLCEVCPLHSRPCCCSGDPVYCSTFTVSLAEARPVRAGLYCSGCSSVAVSFGG